MKIINRLFGRLEQETETVSDFERVAESIAHAFMNDDLDKIDLNPHGISYMSLWWEGVEVEVSWYSRDSNRSISIGGDEFFPVGPSNEIFAAAKARAQLLTLDKLSSLSDRVPG